MLKVAIVCVNYNSDESAVQYIKSVVAAEEQVSDGLELSIIIVDNSERKTSEEFFEQFQGIKETIRTVKAPENAGYFGGVRYGLEEEKLLSGVDYLIVSNVDLKLRNDFFSKLIAMSLRSDCGVIAPSIISSYRKKDLNPKIIKRPSRWMMKFYEKVFSAPSAFLIYEKFSVYRQKVRYVLNWLGIKEEKVKLEAMRIYAPHGAIILFTKEYLKGGGHFDYPVFLFGEEVFVAETARSLNMSVVYDPNLVVYDDDHVSTGKLKRRKRRKFYAEAAKYLYATYFSNSN